ncbi:capsule assembly Wzi family protein [Spirosoma litoris]
MKSYFILFGFALSSFFLFFTRVPAIGQFHNRPIYDTATCRGVVYRAEIAGLTSTNGNTPFWLRSNQFGTVPWDSPTGIGSVGFTALWGNARQPRKLYFKAGVELVGNLNQNSRLILPEAYASIRLGHGELYIGRRKEINGLTDTLLTSGSVAWSGNALPITQIRLGTRDFTPLKFTSGVLAINAFFSQGWFANSDSMQHVMLHAKSVFLRFGKPNWKFRLYGGINHFVQWGGYLPVLPAYMHYFPGGTLTQNGHLASSWKAYKAVVWPIGQPGGDEQFTTIDTLNQVGNHLGSIDFAIDIQLRQSNIYAYYQHLYEDGSGLKFQNFPDGLWGVRWKNLSATNDRWFQLKQLTFEFLTSLNRSGNDPIYGGDDYFFNAQYPDGWVNKASVIGTPIFTRTADIPAAMRNGNDWFSRNRPVNNNAVQTLHMGLYALAVQKIPLVLLVTANKYYEWPMIEKNYNQLYMSLEANNISLGNPTGLKAGIKLAYDTGDIFTNNLGVMVMIRKEGMIR